MSPIPNPAHLVGAVRKSQRRNNFIRAICQVWLLRKGRTSRWSCLGCVTAAHMRISQSHGAVPLPLTQLPSWLVSNVIQLVPILWFPACSPQSALAPVPSILCLALGRHCCPGHGHLPSSASAVSVLRQKSVNKHTHTHKWRDFCQLSAPKHSKEISWVLTEQMGHNSAVRVKAKHETATVPI